MTEDQLKHANNILHTMKEHLRVVNTMNIEYNEEYNYTLSDGNNKFPDALAIAQNIQRRDWHKLRAYELAEEFAKL